MIGMLAVHDMTYYYKFYQITAGCADE